MTAARTRTGVVAALAVLSWLGLAVWLGSLAKAQASFSATSLAPSPPGVHLPYSGSHFVEYRGWSFPDDGYRWSWSREASMVVKFSEPVPTTGTGRLTLHTRAANTPLTAQVWVNDCQVGEMEFRGGSEEPSLDFENRCLRSEGRNTVLLQLPNARPPAGGELRYLGVALEWFSIATVGG